MTDTPINWIWIQPSQGDVDTEMQQCREEGRDLEALVPEYEELRTLDFSEPSNRERFGEFLDKTIQAPTAPGYAYVEPSDLEGIRAERRKSVEPGSVDLSEDALFDKVYGAWLGRISGCMLGKPVEGRRPWMIRKYLESQGRWPLDDYFSFEASDDVKKECFLEGDWRSMAVEGITMAIEDDDTNYTTTGLAIVRSCGRDFTPEHVASFWLTNIPVLHTCTAERVAYRNLLNLVRPPQSASCRNVYREWIGAQIRADFFGYIAPGDTSTAAEFAWRDACISHVKNGIYGEMWVAAMLAAAYVTDDVEQVISAGLDEVPARSRLHSAVSGVLDRYRNGATYEEAILRLYAEWREDHAHHWCHTISNAIVVAIALLWGERDFTRTLGYAVMPGFDTDCNGATAGSILGLILGAKALPEKWTAPLNDTLETGVAGYHHVRISDMAKETVALMRL